MLLCLCTPYYFKSNSYILTIIVHDYKNKLIKALLILFKLLLSSWSFIISLIMKGYKILTKLGIEIISKNFEKQVHQIHMQIGSLPKLFTRFNIRLNGSTNLVHYEGLTSLWQYYDIDFMYKIHYHFMQWCE